MSTTRTHTFDGGFCCQFEEFCKLVVDTGLSIEYGTRYGRLFVFSSGTKRLSSALVKEIVDAVSEMALCDCDRLSPEDELASASHTSGD